MDTTRCYPGSLPKCWNCGAILLYLGRTPNAPCVTPNGRVDRHMSLVSGGFPGKPLRCSFCGRPSWSWIEDAQGRGRAPPPNL